MLGQLLRFSQVFKIALFMTLIYFDQQEPAIGLSHSPLYLQSGSNNEYFSRLDSLI